MFLEPWYEASPFFFILSASSTLLFLVSCTLLFSGGDTGVDALEGTEGALEISDTHLPSDVAFKFYSTQSITAFLMGMGWSGLSAQAEWNLPFIISLALAVFFGLILMTFTASMLYQIRKLNHVGKKNIYTALGKPGLVYTTIPAEQSGIGKVEVIAGGQKKILSAVSYGPSIESFQEVEVIGIKDKKTLIVRPKALIEEKASALKEE